jgi:PAS domain S-box-containing protein
MSPDPAALRLLDALPQLVWVAGPDGTLEYLNRRCAEYSGLAVDDLLGWDWGWVIHPDDLPTALVRWNESVVNGTSHREEFRIRRADGQYRWFLTRGEPTRDADGAVVRWVGTCTDVDDLRRAGADAREDRRLVRAFVERAPDGLALVGGDRLVRYASPALGGLLGRPPGVFPGTDALDWAHRDDRPRLAAAAADLLTRSGGQAVAGARLRHADGSYRRVILKAVNLLPDPDVRAVAVAVASDVVG